MKITRRSILTGAAATAATSIAASSALAQNAVMDAIQAPRRGNWNDQFDARMTTGTANVNTVQPVFGQQTVSSVERAMMQYQNIVAQGGWPMVPAEHELKVGTVHPSVAAMRRRLMVSGDLDSAAGNSDSFDSYVDGAVKRFQARHGLPADGVMDRPSFAAMNVPANLRLGQLQTNMARLQGTEQPQGRYVMVNIPAAQIEAVENGQVALRHTAIVGKTDRQTPLLTSQISDLNFNPYWTAPKSIIRKDIIPLMRDDPTYLSRNKIRIFDGSGNELDPATINWGTDDAVQYTFRQDPSRINAMASTKINFPNPHAVYMHDTPQKSLFGKLQRFESSGCVRVQNIRDLSTWVLKNTSGWDRRAIEKTIASGDRVDVKVADPVKLHFAYITAWSNDAGVVHFRDDMYGRDGSAELALR